MIKKIEGIIVSEVDYKESSKIINVLSPTEGIVGILARGTKKIKSNLLGVTSKMTYGYFHVNYKENGLSTLIEVDVIDSFKNIRQSIDLISYASYLLELSSMVYKHDNDAEIYNLLNKQQEYFWNAQKKLAQQELFSTKSIPGAKKVGGHWLTVLI